MTFILVLYLWGKNKDLAYSNIMKYYGTVFVYRNMLYIHWTS